MGFTWRRIWADNSQGLSHAGEVLEVEDLLWPRFVMTTESQRRHVMLVEDDRDIRESLIEILDGEGYQVTGADDGLHALELLDRGPQPDVILLDLMMPRMNGFEFREQQLQRPELAAIPVIVITASNDVVQKAASMNAAGYLRKPMRLQPLLTMLERMLSPAPG